jgi:hypothetical protein
MYAWIQRCKVPAVTLSHGQILHHRAAGAPAEMDDRCGVQGLYPQAPGRAVETSRAARHTQLRSYGSGGKAQGTRAHDGRGAIVPRRLGLRSSVDCVRRPGRAGLVAAVPGHVCLLLNLCAALALSTVRRAGRSV